MVNSRLLFPILILALGPGNVFAAAKRTSAARAVVTEPVKVDLEIISMAEGQLGTPLPALLLSPNSVVAQIPEGMQLQNLTTGRGVCFPSASCISLKPVKINLQKNQIWFESSQKLVIKGQKVTRTIASTTADNSRAIASLIGSEINRWSKLLYESYTKTKSYYLLGGARFSARPGGMACANSSLQVKDESLQKLIYGGRALFCESSTSGHISESFQYGYTTRFGYVDLWSNRQLTDDQKTKLLSEIGMPENEDLKGQSTHVQQSTHLFCDQSVIREEDVEVHTCTRTLRQFPDLQDTVFIFGKKRNQRLYYNVVRLSGFGQETTKRMVESFISVLGGNP